MRVTIKHAALLALILGCACVPRHGAAYRLAPLWNEACLIKLAQISSRDSLTVNIDNSVLDAEVGSVYEKIRKNMAWQPPNPSVQIVQEPIVLLWPDGLLQIGEPILSILQDEAMLAALIAHLMSHIVYGNLSAGLEDKYPSDVFNVVEVNTEKDNQQRSRALAEALHKGYPPSWEEEADQGAVVAMIGAHYDPAAMSDAWAILNHSNNKAIKGFAEQHSLNFEKAKTLWVRLQDRVVEPITGWVRNTEIWQNALLGIKLELTPIEPK